MRVIVVFLARSRLCRNHLTDKLHVSNTCKLLFGVSSQFAEGKGREFLMRVIVVFLAQSRLCRNQLMDAFYVTNICKLPFRLSAQHSECKLVRQKSSCYLRKYSNIIMRIG